MNKCVLDHSFAGTVAFNLCKVSGSHRKESVYNTTFFYAPQGYEYDLKIYKVSKPDSGTFYLDYNKDIKKDNYGKVNALKVVRSKEPIPVYTFKYSKNQTEVFDCFNNQTTYTRANCRLEKITQGNYRTFKYHWDSKGNLLNKGLQTIGGQTVKCTSFKYDGNGNIAEQTVSGNITGNGPDTFNVDGKGVPSGKMDQAIHKFAYSADGMNLRTKEFLPNGTSLEYHYKPNTNLLIKKLTISDGQSQLREFNTYDENSLLTRTIEDDGQGDFDSLEGVTYRLITTIEPELNEKAYGYTQPKVITESYFDLKTGTEKLLKRTELIYNQADLISEKCIYDADGEYRYSLFYEYNARHKCVREINAMGEETLYKYDDNDNLIYKEIVGSQKRSLFKYDLLNHLIEETEKCDDGLSLKTTHKYDLLGNRLSTTDPYGGVTRYTYDAYGREISQTDPLGNAIFTEYDLLDNPVKITDKEGHVVLKKYTIGGKPFEIQYPDGTQEKFLYLHNGNLSKKWNKDGTQITYLYDYLDRITCESRYDQGGNLVKQEQYQYKGKNLVCHTDAMGIDTHYTYDCAGRLQSKMRAGIEEIYTYDSLGRLWKTITGDRVQIKEYDLRDRVIEERVEDHLGNIYKKETSQYDASGYEIRHRVYTNENAYSETQTIYNGKNLPLMVIDCEGNETQYFYTYEGHFEKIGIDPLGKQTHEVYDLLNRVVTREVTHSGTFLAKEEYGHSPKGYKIKQRNDVIESGQITGSSLIEWTYDPSGNVLSQIEQAKKATLYHYIHGRLSTTTKPDSVVLEQTYDSLGRISTLSSSDGTIRYAYQYDLNDNLLKVADLNSNHSVDRCYDAHNRLIHEKQATGIEFDFSYDAQDRLHDISWQDNKIVYEYSPTALVSASRHKGGQELYRYEQTVDWRGKVIAAILPNGAKIDYAWDQMGRCIGIESPHFHQHLFYDPVGNLMATTLNDGHTTFNYDHLYQLISESGRFSNQYTFDSLNNRRSKNDAFQDIDDLHQLLSDSEHVYQYDQNGNRTSKGNAYYSYVL